MPVSPMPVEKGHRIVGVRSAYITTSMGGEAYAQWVRRAISRVRSAGDTIIPLFDSSVEEPVDLLRDVVEHAFRDPITDKYQSVFVSGNPYVLDALAARYQVPAKQILPTTGATSGLSIVYRAFLRPGDHLLVESPGFDLFADIGRSLGAEVDHFTRVAPDFFIDERALEARITPRTKLIVLSDLHNPSGMLLAPGVIGRIADMAARHGVHLVVDEVYGDYASLGHRLPTAALASPNVIAVNSLTKIYGLSTLRCGWLIATEELFQPIRSVSDHFEFGVSKLSHAVAALVLGAADRFGAYTKDVLDAARPIIARHHEVWCKAGLVEGVLPEFGCIYFPRIIGVGDTLRFSDWLADKYGVVVAPGEFFGLHGHIRLGFAHEPGILEYGLARFSEGLSEYLARGRRTAESASAG
jgi:aspartate/methionine/tyrosine aminotransferase